MDIERKRILLVEDEAIIALAEQKLLEKNGFQVERASTGEVAIQAARNGVDLILMDIDLGRGITGAEAASRILSERDVPIVFLTSHVSSEVVKTIRNIVHYGYVVKGSGELMLLATITTAFSLFESYARLKAEIQRMHKTGRIAGFGTWQSAPDGKGLFLSEGAADILGLGTQAAEIADSGARMVHLHPAGAAAPDGTLRFAVMRGVDDRDRLQAEIHKRIKGGIEVIAGLLSLAEADLGDGKAASALRNARGRLMALKALYDKLSLSVDYRSVPAREYLEELAIRIARSHTADRDITVETYVENLSLGMDQLLPLGMIVQELIALACDHAFPNGRPGMISLAAYRRAGDSVEVVIGDDGIDPAEREGEIDELEMGLVHELAKRLSATVERCYRGGTTYRIRFSLGAPD